MFDKAVSLKPRDAGIFLAAAQFYWRRRRDASSCMALHKQALRVDAEHVPSLLSYARFLEFDRKDLKNAATFYQRAVEVKGAGAEAAAEALGEAARFASDRLGNLDVAEQALKRAMARTAGQVRRTHVHAYMAASHISAEAGAGADGGAGRGGGAALWAHAGGRR